MARDKKKKSVEQKAAKQAKQTKKAAKSEKKVKAKNVDADSDADDNVDLDAVLAAFAEEQAKFLKVTEQPCSPPTPRSSATFLASPSNRNELFLFGGEYYDGTSALFYNDLLVYQVNQGEWRHITSPNSPLPRSGHAWCRGGNIGGIYLFGGEFSSPKQGTFYHYNDFWHLDTDSREWTRLESKGKNKSPPARSGHRMTYWKNYIILFGGFQDTSQQTKYLQDTWIYDTRENVWHEFKLAPAAQKPDARSSFSWLPHESGAVMFGGYSRVKATVGGKQQGKQTAQRNVLRPMVHQDSWFLRLTQPLNDAPPGTPPTMRWERRKKPANIATPERAGITMAHHKGRGVFFGGVHDVELSEEGIDSEFFQDLFVYNIDRNRMFSTLLRRPKVGGKARTAPRTRNRGRADEEDGFSTDDEDNNDDEMEIDSNPDEIFSPTPTNISSPRTEPEPEIEETHLASQDPRPFPRPFESRADFFRRTTNEWQKYVLDYIRDAASLEIKELREKAFAQAEERWWDCREEVQALEDEQEAAGIGDVVSLAERGEGGGGSGSGGGGKRR